MEQLKKFVSEQRFRCECIDAGRPGLLLGGASQWPAVRLWTPEHLAERLGDKPCEVAFSPDGTFDYASRLVTRRHVTFRQAAEQIEHGPPEGGSLYLMQRSVDRDLPELAADIQPPRVMPEAGAFPFFWFGSSGNVTPVHYDGVNNLFAQVRGRKAFILFEPSDAIALYPRPIGSALSHLGQVNVENPDLGRFPGYRDARPIGCSLEPGDLLFIPAFFWHHVRSLETAISVNFWWAPRLEQCLVPSFLRQLRECYVRDRLRSVGAPISNYPGGFVAAAIRAAEWNAPEFAVLFAGAAIEQLAHKKGPHADSCPGIALLRAWLGRLAEPVAAGIDCTIGDANRMIANLVAFEPD